MRLSLSVEHKTLVSSVRQALEQQFPSERLRDNAGPDLRREILATLGGLGLFSALVPEEAGGLSLGLSDIIAAIEAVGSAVGDGPWVEALALGPLALDEGAIAGKAMLAFAAEDRLVAFAAEADTLVVWRNDALEVLDRGAWAAAAQPGLSGSTPLAVVTTTTSGPAHGLTAADVDLVRERGSLVCAAIECGVAAQLIRMTADYVRQREQFGAPIGSFQAVKHRLADTLADLEIARPLVWAASWLLDHDEPDARDHISAARLCSARAAATAAATALQFHGAIGYTLEHSLGVWLKAAWGLADRWDGARTRRRRLAQSLLNVSV